MFDATEPVNFPTCLMVGETRNKTTNFATSYILPPRTPTGCASNMVGAENDQAQDTYREIPRRALLLSVFIGVRQLPYVCFGLAPCFEFTREEAHKKKMTSLNFRTGVFEITRGCADSEKISRQA